MAKKKVAKKRRLVLGKDFDAWGWKRKDGTFLPRAYSTKSQFGYPKRAVRVRFMEVQTL